MRSDDWIAISDKISKLNINKSAACGYRPKKGIHIARQCVNGYCITATTAKSVTYMSFRGCVYVTTFQTQSKGSLMPERRA